MAKTFIGNLCKAKEKGRPAYIQIRKDKDFVLKAGSFLSVETKAQQLESVSWLIKNGKISSQAAEEMKAKLDKTPDFVQATVFVNTPKTSR